MLPQLIIGREGAGMTALQGLRRAALAEGTTLVLLVLVAVPLKHLAGWPLAVQVMGPVHGLAFLAWTWALIASAPVAGWRPLELAQLLGGAVVPFGALINDRLIRRRAAEIAA